MDGDQQLMRRAKLTASVLRLHAASRRRWAMDGGRKRKSKAVESLRESVKFTRSLQLRTGGSCLTAPPLKVWLGSLLTADCCRLPGRRWIFSNQPEAHGDYSPSTAV